MKYISPYTDFMTPELLERAKIDLGETPEVKKKAVQELRDLLKGEPNLKPRMDEKFLIRYLRAKKYDALKAFKTMCRYYTFNDQFAGQVTKFKPHELKHVLDMKSFSILPYRDSDGSPVALIRAGLFDETKATAEEFIATSLLCSEVFLEQEGTLISGSVVVLDLSGFTMRKTMQFSSATIISLLVSSFQDCVACRLKGFHVVNEPYFCTVFFKLIKKCLQKKIRDRVFFHGSNLKNLHKHIPPQMLPECLGGKAQIDDEEYEKFILSKQSYFEDLNTYGYASVSDAR